jgi:hypothetical protein
MRAEVAAAAWRAWARRAAPVGSCASGSSWLRPVLLPLGGGGGGTRVAASWPRGVAFGGAAGRATFATRSRSHVKFSEKKKHVPAILLRDFEPLGRQGDEVQVSPGYMRNYLYGRKLAVYSTVENKRSLLVDRSVGHKT